MNHTTIPSDPATELLGSLILTHWLCVADFGPAGIGSHGICATFDDACNGWVENMEYAPVFLVAILILVSQKSSK